MTVSADTVAGAAIDNRYTLVSQAIQELRPFLQADGGDCEFVGMEDNVVRVRMSGACIGCQFSASTIMGVQERLVAKLGMPLRVIPVPSVR
jgi:NifU-like protein